MNRRGFFRALVGAVVALPTLPELLVRPIAAVREWAWTSPWYPGSALGRALRKEEAAMGASFFEHFMTDDPLQRRGTITFTRVKKLAGPEKSL